MTDNNKIEEAKEKIFEKHFRNQNVVESIDCEGCFFEGSDKCGAAYFYSPCSKKFRSDGKSIIFKEVKE